MQDPATRRGSLAFLVVTCFVAALGGLLFGYDTAVISGAIGPMEAHFGMTPRQVGWATGCALIGCALGVALAGFFSDRFGRRNTLVFSAVLFLVSAIGTAVPRDLWVFVAFRILGGLGVGAASMTSPMYIAEITPARIRGRMVSVNQFAIVFGMLVVFFVNYAIARQGDDAWNQTTGWRWMFGSEAIPATVFLLLLFFVPESPRWLAKRGRSDRAREILARVDGPEHAERGMQEIRQSLAQKSGFFIQLFLPGLRSVLVIGIVLAVLQQVTGINVFLYYAPEILKGIAGEKTDIALLQTILVGAVNMVFTVVAIWTVDRLGRKPLMIVGAAGMGIALAAIGVASWLQVIGGWLLVCILGYIACFALSVGPVTWVILSEIFPTRIRGRAMAIATFCLWLANYVISQTFPMMDKNEWLVANFNHGFPFVIYGAFCVVLVLFVWRAIPETKGRSLEEIERMWLAGPGPDGEGGAR